MLNDKMDLVEQGVSFIADRVRNMDELPLIGDGSQVDDVAQTVKEVGLKAGKVALIGAVACTVIAAGTVYLIAKKLTD